MILVAGGTGHLGRELVPLLTGQGLPVRILTRDPDRARQLLGELPEMVAGDARTPASLDAALRGADAVISAMTGFGPGGPGPRQVDYEGNLNLIRAAEGGASRFILVSMHGAAAEHPMELLRMKQRAEMALKASRLDWTIVRPTVFMELWAGLVGDPIVRSGKTTVFGRGENPVNFVSARDVARFVELALHEPDLSRRSLDVGGPDNLTFNEVVRRIEAAADRKAKVRYIPAGLMRLARPLLRPMRPDLAGMVEAGIATDSADMRFDATPLQQRFPGVVLTPLTDVIRERFGEPAAGLSV